MKGRDTRVRHRRTGRCTRLKSNGHVRRGARDVELFGSEALAKQTPWQRRTATKIPILCGRFFFLNAGSALTK